ncbi:MAG TPA: hypothetical protein VN176_12685 [Verrucomicrobiae bacterium]|jgi:hypothetical protein|nr:hypothetical protein [Verrucomicrobiae bacterium]
MKDIRDKKPAIKTHPKATRMALKRSGARTIKVRHLSAPPSVPRAKAKAQPKRIHARHLLPLVKEGAERPFHSATTRAMIHSLDAPGQPLQTVLNTALTQAAQNRTSGNVNEPSAAINGDVVFFTGNWYAAMSPDGGNTFKFIDPNTMAQASDPAAIKFCCDQVVNYLSSIDTFVWLLQYGPSSGDNLQRLAFAKSADVVAGKWRTFDITPAALEVPGAFLDFPDLAVGANFLYMTTNIFMSDNTAGSAVVRIPLSSIDSGQPTAEKFVSVNQGLQSFRVAQNCGPTAFFAAHKDTSTLEVFSWPEGQAAPVSQEVPVARWIGGNGYFSRLPDGRRWLDRADPRITGATLAGSELWFAWSVDSGSNHRPNPFVQIARINSQNMTLIDNVNLFDSNSAICYAGLSSNAANEVGVSYMIGGAEPPSHVVGILGDQQQSLMVAKGDRGPLPDPNTGSGDWGDFLTVRPVFPDRKLFAATGYTFQGTKDGDNLDATPDFVIFGRADAPAVLAAQAAKKKKPGGRKPAAGKGGGGKVVGGPVVAGGPITDVNKLSVVSQAVAAEIKAACGVNTPARAFMPEMDAMLPQLVTAPGVERWPVKTGTDPDRNLVGKNVIAGKDLGMGIVDATVEEMITIPRPADMASPTGNFPLYQSKRAQPLEIVIWQLDVTITALKLEADGDYHLVLQGTSGETMIGEVPTPNTTFVGDSPWLQNITDARKAVDDKLVSGLSPKDFALAPNGKMLIPRSALSSPPPVMANFQPRESFTTAPEGQEGQMAAFKTQVSPTPARITGVGFFDKVHGQMGVSQSNGIELHPVLKIEWL